MFGRKEILTHTINVEGMMCMNCVAHVKTALEGVKGVKSVEIDLNAKTATVKAPENVPLNKLTDAIIAAGYKVV